VNLLSAFFWAVVGIRAVESASPCPDHFRENAAEASTAGTMTRSALAGLTLNGREPWMYPKDVLERLPTHPNSRNEKLLPHRWKVPSDS
jgi:hypothetical protein